MNSLKKRIIEISYKKGLSHIGSCLTSVDLINAIYESKSPDDPFILSNGHAGLALYVVIEKMTGINAEKIYDHHGTHPNRCGECKIDCSTGSLGHGLGIALGMALADKSKNVYCLVSDGECAEGSIWETIRIAGEYEVNNLVVLVNANGWSALGPIDLDRLEWKIAAFVHQQYPRISFIRTHDDFTYLEQLKGHYHILNESEYKDIMNS